MASFLESSGFPEWREGRRREGSREWREREEQGAVGERGDSVEIEFRSNTATAGEREG